MEKKLAISICCLVFCLFLSSIVATLVTLYFEVPSFYGITTTVKNPTTTTTSLSNIFTKMAISAGFDGANATSGNKDYLGLITQGDGLDWWASSISNAQTFSLDSKGHLYPDGSNSVVCYLTPTDKINISLSSSLTPVVFSYNSSNGQLTDANGNVLGKGPNGQVSGSWPFLISPTAVNTPPNVPAKVGS